MQRAAVVLLFVFLSGCGTATRSVVRLDTGQGDPLVHTPRRDVEPTAVNEKEFKKAVAQQAPSVPDVERPLEYAGRLFRLPERSGWYRYEGRSQRLMASAPGSTGNLRLLPQEEELKRRYLRWCEQGWGGGDCLRLLMDKPFLDGDAKYALAMAIAHTKVLGAMKEELARMVSPQAVVATVVGGLTLYAILLALPEPVSKGIAALMTLGAIAYLGWDTVWRLMDGWRVLMEEVDQATTFDGIYASGEKFGDTMGEKAARAFVMLGMVALGNTTAGMAATLPKLPGAGQAAMVAETQLNIRWTAPALAQVESVAITAEGVTLALAPNTVAMAARDSAGGKAGAKAPPPGSGGPGKWVQADEYMPEQSRRYQAQVTGAPEGTAYRVKWGNKEVDFDGFDQGVLLEAKGTGYAKWVDNKELNFVEFFEGRNQMLEQARRQFKAANGTPIRWIIAEEKLASALKKMFREARLSIEVVHIPPATPAR
ncbi:restriction endonuclease fold toxin 5 domain-containing protein [Stigmatella sp. ncwal1]|uniref:Restriction endonuclease fold toxin 5 domain-containing protein n=1 Tax=Stigmatella ashevillensis TaxID=2995309 RepID=A0ABT5D9C5_9BACT|nr:restriction endonuclease fold toxin 5 domain-containing protein [Stigmatella ashevillena]MDC0710277.1 restriction endonuclease fold toxin 5 domain-containing protein [Stigmatella ashevillena]